MRSLQLLIAVVLAVTTTGCVVHQARPAEAHAMRNGYVYLGERWVDGGADHDRIHVGREDGRFASIMLVVENAPIELFQLLVTFGNGATYAIPTRQVFGPDTTTRMIDLPGGARVIRRVDFQYGNLAPGAHAKVELWGR